MEQMLVARRSQVLPTASPASTLPLPPIRKLRIGVLDVISVLSIVYCVLMAIMHLGLSLFPYLVRFFGMLNPVITAVVFSLCAVLHIRTWLHMLHARHHVNKTAAHLRKLSTLAATAAPRRHSNSIRLSGIAPSLHHPLTRPATDLDVLHDDVSRALHAARVSSLDAPTSMQTQATVAGLMIQETALRVRIKLEKIYATYWGRHGIFSRRGLHYELRLLARECVVVPVQFIRGYNVSTRIHSSLNLTYGLVLGLHCVVVLPWVTWNLHLFRSHLDMEPLRKRRVRVGLVIILFDLVLGVVLPVSLALPVLYDLVLDPKITTDQTWDIYAISVLKSIMIITPVDMLAAVVPLLLLAWTVQNVHSSNVEGFLQDQLAASKAPTRRRKQRFRSVARAAIGLFKAKARTIVKRAPQLPHQSKSLLDSFTLANLQPSAFASTWPRPAVMRNSWLDPLPPLASLAAPSTDLVSSAWLQRRFVFFGLCSCLSVAWGGLIVTRSYFTTACYQDTPPPFVTCTVQLYPWHVVPLVHQVCQCQILHVDCAALAPDVILEQSDAYLATRATTFLNHFTMENCPLHAPRQIPTSVARFTELYFLRFFNCSLEATDITLDLSLFPRVLFVSFYNNNIQDIPPAFKQLPPLALGFSLDYNNLSHATFPPWIATAWGSLTQIYLRRTNMTSFPPAFLGLEWITVFDLTSNAISQLPPLPATSSYWTHLAELRLANNSLETVPPAILAIPTLKILTLGGNRLTQCPAASHVMTMYTLTGNPCCGTTTDVSCAPMCDPACDSIIITANDCYAECNSSACKAANAAATCLSQLPS
ncbi:Aste57867_13641 [Aphanomyces stellatus]|uniref:Aste57867_13641 protein n=1 Tax=Aphanomyces stellatus TaxID=120398 RepID=A0A485KYN5_9STRA|nr:hypothetical protein As57867_013591 [Aphanomyces stellatus]VFT90478.1 Aste57867_13641 [Aphanomyces stellatus]